LLLGLHPLLKYKAACEHKVNKANLQIQQQAASVPAVVSVGQCHSPVRGPGDTGLDASCCGPCPKLLALTVKSFWLSEGGLGTFGGKLDLTVPP